MSSYETLVHRAAVGVLITDFQGRVLLVSNPYRVDLVQVGGMVEAGEPPAEAAERETLEEIGLEPEEAIARHTEPGRERLRQALAARKSGRTAYLDHDRVLGG